MSNERPDDFLSWRRTLSQPDALSEHGLEDRELSWEKLAERLRDKPRRRWTGYWIAAACLLLALVPAARLFRDHHPRAESPRPTALRSTALRPATLRPVALPPVALPSAALHPAAHPATPHPAAAPHSTPPITAAGPLTAALADLPAAAPPQTTLATAATPAKPKKQLRIVNINEISKGESPAPATARREPGFLRIGTTIPDPPGPSSDDPALLKIKLSSQNR
jgi:hypothetical protein